MALEYYQAFREPSPYEQERLKAERLRRYAELLEQQGGEPEGEFTYQGIRAMPSPAAALGKMLQAYQSKKAREKAEEAELKQTGMEEEAASQIMGRLMGGRTPGTIADLTEFKPTGKIGPSSEADLAGVQLESQYTRSPEDAMRMAMTPQGVGAVRGNPMLAAALEQSMKAPEAEYGTTPQYDAQGKAYVINKAGQIRYLDGITRPEGEAPTSFREFKLSQTTPGYREFIESRTPKTSVDVSYGAPVAGVDAQGNPIYFQPSRTGGAPSIIPGVKPKPEAMGANESTAALFADRMAEAAPIFDVLAPPTVGATAKGAVPGVGNIMLSPQNRQFMQAERNFISAVLRKESGAAISPSEFDEARKLYIPQAGDDPQTLEMKRQTRINAVRGISQGAGPSYKMPPLTPPDGVTPAEWAAMTLEERRRFAR